MFTNAFTSKHIHLGIQIKLIKEIYSLDPKYFVLIIKIEPPEQNNFDTSIIMKYELFSLKLVSLSKIQRKSSVIRRFKVSLLVWIIQSTGLSAIKDRTSKEWINQIQTTIQVQCQPWHWSERSHLRQQCMMQSTNYAKAVTDKVLQKNFLVKNGLNLFQSLRLQKWFEAICHGNLSGSQSGLIQMCNWNNE